MRRSTEQRVGGPNSLRALRESGFSAPGYHPDQTQWRGVEVKPVIVTTDVGTPAQKTFTIFQPRSRQPNGPTR